MNTMNDLEQYEIAALQRDALIDGCEDSLHMDGEGQPYSTTRTVYDDGAVAVSCTNCDACIDFIDPVS